MCGFAGIYSSEQASELQLSQLASMMASELQHRGPDDDGCWSDDVFAVAHRRLSVIDRSSSGSQPMKSQCGRYVIAFNGEIYNHRNMRNEILSSQPSLLLKGHSDTETLLENISTFGLLHTLENINGMFSFALWDRKDRSLYLARDRLGEKPLYWGWSNQSLIFGSELKALRKHPGFCTEISEIGLLDYLRYAYIPAPLTIFKNIYKLEPGTFLKASGSIPICPPNQPIRPGQSHYSVSIEHYWKPIDRTLSLEISEPQSEQFYVGELHSRLRSAVSRQMYADVPIGAFLSGGIDSSLITAIMSEYSSQKVNTFTIGFQDCGFDEAPYAREISKVLDTNHLEYYLSNSDVLDLIPRLPKIYDEPFADSSQIPTCLISGLARSKVTVVLSGDGADEIFGGYPRYLFGEQQFAHLRRIPFGLRKNIFSPVLSFLDEETIKQLFLRGSLLFRQNNILNPYYKIIRLLEKLSSVNSILDMNSHMSSIWTRPELILKRAISDQGASPETLIQMTGISSIDMMNHDLLKYLPDDLICKVDRASMNFGLEARMPYLDNEIVEFALALPCSIRGTKSQTKWILKRILERYIPSKLIDRPKSGFSIPLASLLRDPLKPWCEELLSEYELSKSGYFKTDIIRRTWREHLSGQYDWSGRLWNILMFQAWYRTLS